MEWWHIVVYYQYITIYLEVALCATGWREQNTNINDYSMYMLKC